MTPLWIGGAPGSGKSTVARALARRYGLRWYNADTRTWAHRDAALAAGDPDARRFEELGPVERWRRPLPELLRMSLHRVRGPMVAADVRALPAPTTLAEGSCVTPAVTGTDPAVWLLASADTRRRRLTARGVSGAQLALYLELGEVIAAEAADAAVLSIDDLTPAAAIAAVARRFGAALSTGPRATTAAERRELARWSNREIVAQCRGFADRPWSTVTLAEMVRDFGCECGGVDCVAEVRLTVADYAPPVLAEGHFDD